MKILDHESRAKIALLGGNIDWRTTPIEVTAAARATDPLRLSRDGWWKNAEPRDAEGREIIRLTDGRTLRLHDGMASAEHERERDATRHQSEKPHSGVTAGEIAAHQRDKEKVGVDDLELAPQENETVSAWLARLAQHIDTNDAQKILWSALQGYVSRFRGDAKAKKSLDAKVVRAFLNAVN